MMLYVPYFVNLDHDSLIGLDPYRKQRPWECYFDSDLFLKICKVLL